MYYIDLYVLYCLNWGYIKYFDDGGKIVFQNLG